MIEILDDYGLIYRSPAPWRGEGLEGWDVYPVSPDDLLTPFLDQSPINSSESLVRSNSSVWADVGERINEIGSQRPGLPPPESVEALAWYLPFHYFAEDWGIYIKEEEVIRFAGYIKQRLGGGRSSPEEIHHLCHVAMVIFYLHEAFHHKIESFATRVEIVNIDAIYIPYDVHVFQPMLGTDEVLEEAFACTEMITRLNRSLLGSSFPQPILRSAVAFLYEWIPTLPPGYRRGVDFTRKPNFGPLLSQVANISKAPFRSNRDWEIANHMTRGLFSRQLIAHFLVPTGTQPLLPWLGGEKYLAISTRDVERHITKNFGYVDTGRGKGSHRHFHCHGRPPITLPSRREALSFPVQRQVAEALGYKNVLELAAMV